MSIFTKAVAVLITTFMAATAVGTVTNEPTTNPLPDVRPVEIAAVTVAPPAAETGIQAVDATPDQRERLDHAVELFEEMGLDLPAVRVHFENTTDDCNGHAGLYHRAEHDAFGKARAIQICDGLLVTLIHELAHAWADEAVDQDRRADLVEIWGLETWSDHEVEWGERGTERAAQAITAAFIIDFSTDNPGILRNVCNFELVTGRSLPDPSLFDCTTA